MNKATEKLREEIKWWVSSFGSEVMARVQDNKLDDLPKLTDGATDQILKLLKDMGYKREIDCNCECPYFHSLEEIDIE